MKPIIIPLLAALAQATSLLFAKICLTRRRISIKDYIPGLFFFLSVFSLLSLTKLGQVNFSALTHSSVLIKLALIIGAATIWNVAYYIGLSKEKVNTSEGIMILMPLATIMMAWLVEPAGFRWPVAIAGAGATSLILWAYSGRKVFQLDKYTWLLIVAVIFTAVENVLVSQVLQTGIVSPAALYTMRTLVVFTIFYLYYRPSLLKVKFINLIYIAFSALLGATMMILRFYGLRDAGVTLTALILILVPALILIAAALFLHERIKPKRLVATTLVVGLIVYATIYTKLGH